MKKRTAFIVFILIVAVSVITCPSKEMHKDAIQTTLKNVITKDFDSSSNKLADAFLMNIGSALTGLTLDGTLTVDNYFVCSVGKIGLTEKKQKIVSVGVFNHVFTISEEEIETRIQK